VRKYEYYEKLNSYVAVFCLGVLAGLVLVMSGVAGCNSTAPPSSLTQAQKNVSEPESKDSPLANRPGIVFEAWGIEVKTIMLSANGYMLDFRFKILDAEKARPLFGHDKHPVLVDQATGATLIVPAPPKSGPLRQTSYEPKQGRIHFILFANPGRLVKRGDKVNVVIGDFHAENLVVE